MYYVCKEWTHVWITTDKHESKGCLVDEYPTFKEAKKAAIETGKITAINLQGDLKDIKTSIKNIRSLKVSDIKSS